jgi:hypothetical protein
MPGCRDAGPQYDQKVNNELGPCSVGFGPSKVRGAKIPRICFFRTLDQVGSVGTTHTGLLSLALNATM